MNSKATAPQPDDSSDKKEKVCFVIMPISDQDGYDAGHFGRVYNHIIKPACIKAGFVPVRADEVSGTNMIVIDILQKIIKSDMAVCDLSSRNPNVLYELGIRQSFDLPVTLLKDDATPRVFDIQGFRDVFYKKSLRFDEVTDAVDRLAVSIKETYDNKGKEVNSIVELMGITSATIKEPIQISPDTEVVLNALRDVSQRLSSLESKRFPEPTDYNGRPYRMVGLVDKTFVGEGEKIMSKKHGEGTVIGIIDSDENPGKTSLMIQFGSINFAFTTKSDDLYHHPDTPLQTYE